MPQQPGCMVQVPSTVRYLGIGERTGNVPVEAMIFNMRPFVDT